MFLAVERVYSAVLHADSAGPRIEARAVALADAVRRDSRAWSALSAWHERCRRRAE